MKNNNKMTLNVQVAVARCEKEEKIKRIGLIEDQKMFSSIEDMEFQQALEEQYLKDEEVEEISSLDMPSKISKFFKEVKKLLF